MVSIASDPTLVAPGQTVTLTVSISNSNGPVAGFFLQSNGVGAFSIVDPGTKLIGPGVTHNRPRTGSGSQTQFTVGWTAPAVPGGVDFNVWANSANGDGKSSGDGGGSAFFSMAFGCSPGTKYYRDNDADGAGALPSGYTVNCSLPPNFSAMAGDCDDNSPSVYPGAPEVCNGKDDNCDGHVDEGLPMTGYCVDKDGDGHGVSGGMGMTGCRPSMGFGLCDDDCNDNDASVYPGAPELCNGRDDNCNGQTDEGARLVCGVGWCARYGAGCSTTLCTPGEPRAEECNAFDDDCDGVADNGTDLELCGKPGLHCRDGVCVGAGAGVGVGAVDSQGGGASHSGAGSCALSGARGGCPRVTAWWANLLICVAWMWRRQARRAAVNAG